MHCHENWGNIICFQDLPLSGFCVWVLRIRDKEGCKWLQKCTCCLSLKLFHSISRMSSVTFSFKKCLEERENLESLGMYRGPWIRLVEKSCWPCATLVSLNLVPTARSNVIRYIMSQTSWLNMMLCVCLSLSLRIQELP